MFLLETSFVMLPTRFQFCRLVLSIALLAFTASPASAWRDPFDHFEDNHVGPSLPNAYLLSLVSNYAYRGKLEDFEGDNFDEKAEHIFDDLGLKLVGRVDNSSDMSDTQAFVLRNRKALIIVFSGSEGQDAEIALKDWLLTDARLQMEDVGGVMIHSGFYHALDIAYEDIRNLVDRYSGRRDVWITGHSLGAALATLTALKMEREQIEVQGVIAYASPRIGDASFAAALETELGERYQGWIIDRDPVPRLPPGTEIFPYVPAGSLNVVSDDGSYRLKVAEEPSEIPNPVAHATTMYVNYLFRALAEEDRKNMPVPPALCLLGQTDVGRHPDNELPLCRNLASLKISAGKCEESGGEIVDSWCAFAVEDRLRYRVRELRPE